MELQYHSIASFQAIQNGENLIIIGMGTDQWMYQYHGEEGAWVRLSKTFPNRIQMGVPDISQNTVTTSTTEIPPADAEPESKSE